MGLAKADRLLVALAAVAVLAGCSTARPLMPTPARYGAPHAPDPFAATVAERRSPDVELLFVTNRKPAAGADGASGAAPALPYGERRSHSLAFGTARVTMGPALDWEAIAAESRLGERTRSIELALGEVAEVGRFPEFPYPAAVRPGGLLRDQRTLARHAETRAAFVGEVTRMLEGSPSRRVILYVHGFNETFSTAAYTAAELCHFLGRQDVCAFFTWPASATGGFLTAYATTTESAQFSVKSLHRTIRMLATIPGVESVELLAHSRGAALALSAMHRLYVEAVVYGIEPAEHHRVRNVVLVAPDIDPDVAASELDVFNSDPDLPTHWSSPYLPRGIGRGFTVYTSPNDKALGASRFLFRSRYRVGQMSPEVTRASGRGRMAREYAKWEVFDIVTYEGQPTDRYGHAYFTTSPRVSADLIEVIRNGTRPDDPARGLVRAETVFWKFPDEPADGGP